jgi:hypothetical protein
MVGGTFEAHRIDPAFEIISEGMVSHCLISRTIHRATGFVRSTVIGSAQQ